MVEEISRFRNLPPEERIKRLEELENRKKKEVEAAGRLIKSTKTEIITKKEKKDQIPIEQLRSVDMDHLVSGEEKDIFKIKRFEAQTNLEEIATEPSPVQHEEHEYNIKELATTPIENIYTQAQQIYQSISSPQEVSRDDFYNAMDIRYAIEEKQEAIHRGTYSPTEELERETNAIKCMVDEIINWYKG